MWEVIFSSTEPVAKKEYDCDAYPWINNAGYGESDFDPIDWDTIKAAEKDNYRILPGTKYIKVTGKYEGDFTVFRARLDLDAICHKYDLYVEKYQSCSIADWHFF